VKTSRLFGLDIRDSEVGVLAISRRAPLDAAKRTAQPGAILPEDLAVLLGVHRERHTRLLSNHNHVPATCARKHRRTPEVEIGTD
jgi:hypothetical protein